MSTVPSIQTLKLLARSLKSNTVSHSQALEIVAQQHGFKDWNAAAALAPKDVPVNPWAFDSIRRKLEHFQGEYLAIKDLIQFVFHQRSDPRFAEFFETLGNYVGEITENAAQDDALAAIRYAGYYLQLPTDASHPGWGKFTTKYREIIMRGDSHKTLDGLIFERIPDLDHAKFPHIRETKLSGSELKKLVLGYAGMYPSSRVEDIIKQIEINHPKRVFNKETVRGIFKGIPKPSQHG